MNHLFSPVRKNGKLLVGLMVALMAGHASAQEKVETPSAVRDGWVTDFEAAKKTAEKEGKDLLLEFTRAKGCGWCIKLENEVLTQDAFKQQVPKNYVLVKLEYPRDQELPEALKKQNEKLLDFYHVRTFPLLVLCDANGRPYAGSSYKNSDAEGYLKHLAELHQRRIDRDQALAAAENLEGEEKARMLEKGLSQVSRYYHHHYRDVIDAIAKADPSDACGFIANIKVGEVKTNLGKLVRPFYEERKFDEIPAVVDGFIKENKIEGEALQVALLYKTQALYSSGKYDEVGKVADEVLAINDASRAARFAKMIKKRIERLSEKEGEE
ncbi:hypothetical protein NT6N_27670 [Oceaniferula spumae]|uniref:Thioredoxin domain-containing protein n=1 Tax=Oceaniferula spumae TaxID=2979115 RepID=A0AAT9FPA0_9BACT